MQGSSQGVHDTAQVEVGIYWVMVSNSWLLSRPFCCGAGFTTTGGSAFPPQAAPTKELVKPSEAASAPAVILPTPAEVATATAERLGSALLPGAPQRRSLAESSVTSDGERAEQIREAQELSANAPATSMQRPSLTNLFTQLLARAPALPPMPQFDPTGRRVQLGGSVYLGPGREVQLPLPEVVLPALADSPSLPKYIKDLLVLPPAPAPAQPRASAAAAPARTASYRNQAGAPALAPGTSPAQPTLNLPNPLSLFQELTGLGRRRLSEGAAVASSAATPADSAATPAAGPVAEDPAAAVAVVASAPVAEAAGPVAATVGSAAVAAASGPATLDMTSSPVGAFAPAYAPAPELASARLKEAQDRLAAINSIASQLAKTVEANPPLPGFLFPATDGSTMTLSGNVEVTPNHFITLPDITVPRAVRSDGSNPFVPVAAEASQSTASAASYLAQPTPAAAPAAAPETVSTAAPMSSAAAPVDSAAAPVDGAAAPAQSAASPAQASSTAASGPNYADAPADALAQAYARDMPSAPAPAPPILETPSTPTTPMTTIGGSALPAANAHTSTPSVEGANGHTSSSQVVPSCQCIVNEPGKEHGDQTVCG